MKKKIIMVLLALAALLVAFVPATSSYSAAPTEPLKEIQTTWTETEVLARVKEIAIKHNVSYEEMMGIVKRECPWKPIEGGGRYYDKNDARSRVRYNEGQIRRHPDWGVVGQRERSYGCVQIHEPAWPEITREQATDLDWSLEFLAVKLSEGKGGMWTTYQPKP